MKKNTLIICFLLLSTIGAFAQYPIGNKSVTYSDPDRSGRNIPCQVYYPAVSAGTGTALASGSFHLIVLGHGFVMTYDAYQNWWNSLVPQGYILVIPTTEGSFSPSHEAFALDMAFLANKFRALNTDAGSEFYNKINERIGGMGHSMGGGAGLLASSKGAFATFVGLAPAETTPSAVAACAEIDVPVLILAGGLDCYANS